MKQFIHEMGLFHAITRLLTATSAQRRTGSFLFLLNSPRFSELAVISVPSVNCFLQTEGILGTVADSFLPCNYLLADSLPPGRSYSRWNVQRGRPLQGNPSKRGVFPKQGNPQNPLPLLVPSTLVRPCDHMRASHLPTAFHSFCVWFSNVLFFHATHMVSIYSQRREKPFLRSSS